MPKVRDFDAEIMALIRKADQLKAKRIEYQGRLVSMTKADDLHVNVLAGALLCAVEADDATKEAWEAKGAAFFQRRGRKGSKAAGGDDAGAATQSGADPAPGSDAATDR